MDWATLGWSGSVLAFVVFLLISHEAAHALVLRTYGGRLTHAGLGLALPPMLTFRATRRRPFILTLSPWLLGAYVLPDEASIESMGRRRLLDQAWFLSAGVIINAVTGFALAVIYFAAIGSWRNAGISLVLGTGIWLARKVVSICTPLVGVVAMIVLLESLLGSLGQARALGALGLGQSLVSTNGYAALVTAISISWGIALLNCLPIYPFDGGRVVDALLVGRAPQKLITCFRVGTGAFALVLVLYTLGTDVFALL